MNNLFKEQYPYLASTIKDSHYNTVTKLTVSPIDLMIPARFDFMAKLIYLDGLKGCYDPFRSYEIYKSHLLAFGGRRIKEAGNPEKNTIEKYINVFQSLNQAANSDDKDTVWCEHYPIPVDANFMAMDGAHRVSCALNTKNMITIYYLKDYSFPYRYDYLFFRYRLLHESMILEMVLKYAKLKSLTLFRVTYKKYSKVPFLLTALKYRNALLPVYMLKLSSKSFLVVTDNAHTSPDYVTAFLKNNLHNRSKLDLITNQEEIIQYLQSFIAHYQKKEDRHYKVTYFIKDRLLRLYFITLGIIKKIIPYF